MSAIHATAPHSHIDCKSVESRVTEILLHNSSVCLQPLLLPMIAGLSREDRWLVLINPPHDITRTALELAGACTRHILVLNTSSLDQTELFCARALAAGTCHTVIAWCSGTAPALDQLNQAASRGNALGILVRT
ncbi:SulA-like leucine-rich domain-containing protein [Marinobacterium sp. MBR-109]|jgi:cell division inhibitor SulA|uniref:SulA-like leucine-rich domain-containing protein n=1 Tax=Marinobacterium sp. MBR-109 TaxID=3156462 RepID=UPI00339886E1